MVKKRLTWKWIYKPPLRRPPRHRRVSATVAEVIRSILETGIIKEVKNTHAFLSLVSLVPKKNSDVMRPVVDLPTLFQFLVTTLLRMLTIAQVRLALRPLYWIVTLDLKEAY